MVLGLGAPELIVILLVALVLFGPKNLPKLGSAVGKTVKNFREGMETDEDTAPVKATAKKAQASSTAAPAEEVIADPDADAPDAEAE